jgi:hypothetical protein
MTKEQEEQGFRVTDKRGFSEETAPAASEPSEKADAKPAGEPSLGKETESAEQDSASRHPIDFQSYVIFCYTRGMTLLGDSAANKKKEEMEEAHYIIDLLSMLEQKTKGNLSSEEQQLLGSVIYELRMKFMAKTNRIKL